jgi:hypothetical protein
MVGFFPTPYPDELLYSLCARFSTRVRFKGVKSVLEDLFGAPTATAIIDLPNRLGFLAKALPANSSLTVDCLIDKHTLFPFFSSFQPASRVNQLRGDLKSSGGTAGHMRSGIMASRVPAPAHLRFCPACKREDKEYYGETYWHRIHQLPGVEVCSQHQVFLEGNNVCLRAGRKHLLFIGADEAICEAQVRRIDLGNRGHRVLLQIARDAAWLINHPSLGTSLKTLHNRYLKLLIKRKFATYTGRIYVGRLLEEFRSFYSSSLLRLLYCEFTGSDQVKTNWLLRLVRRPKHTQHPLYHLLLIQFLGCTVEEFFRIPSEISYFGEGPWPCLNSAADHYQQPIIQEHQLGDRLRYGKPTGEFICKCGFAYVRTGPDSSLGDRFRIGRIISFGQLWEAKLKELWKDSSLSLSEVGRRLGVDPLTVRRHAVRLKLPLTRSGKETKPLNVKTQLQGQTISAKWEKKRKHYRSKWLSKQNHKQKITLKDLRQILPREYAWLRRNDSEWLIKHLPPSNRHTHPKLSVDWRRRDGTYAAAVGDAASQIKSVLGRPIRITKTAIGRVIGAVPLLQQKLNKMPRTAQVLASVVETREQFAVRRVWWAADLYCQEDVLPRKWQLVVRANVYSLKEASAVKCSIEDAINMLESEILQRQAGRAAS